MSYYTGTIFEIGVEGFPGSIAGGGRYDKMVGKFTGMETPACGFSIGFERIVTILLDEGFTVPGSKEKIAYLVEKGVDSKVLWHCSSGSNGRTCSRTADSCCMDE